MWGDDQRPKGAEGDLPTNEGIGTHRLLIWQPLPQVANLLHLGEFLKGGQEILTVLKILVHEIPDSHSIHSDGSLFFAHATHRLLSVLLVKREG